MRSRSLLVGVLPVSANKPTFSLATDARQSSSQHLPQPKRVGDHSQAYVAIFGERHPQAFGLHQQEVWKEAVQSIGPLVQKVLFGSTGRWGIGSAATHTRLTRRSFEDRPREADMAYGLHVVPGRTALHLERKEAATNVLLHSRPSSDRHPSSDHYSLGAVGVKF